MVFATPAQYLPWGYFLLERRLAAILAADVVGFSRMIGANEIGMLEGLRAMRGGARSR
jgi:hypothetical protein